jgi:hypothetical protein
VTIADEVNQCDRVLAALAALPDRGAAVKIAERGRDD